MATEKKTLVYSVEFDADGAVKSMDKLDDSIEKTAESQKELNSNVNSGANALDKMTGGAVSGFRAMVGGLKSATLGMKTLRGAIISTGVGALVVAVGSLVAYFSQTERGAQQLRVVMAGLGAAAGTLSDVFVNLGELIYSAITLDTEQVKKSWETLKESVANFGEELSKDVGNATELEKAMNNVLVKERELRVERALAQQEIAKARAVSQDMDKSAKDRLAAVEKASKLESELTAKEVALAEEKLRILQEQADLNESDEETLNALAEQEIVVANLQTASYQTQLRLAADLKRLKNEIAQEEKSQVTWQEEEGLPKLEAQAIREIEIEEDKNRKKLASNTSYVSAVDKINADAEKKQNERAKANAEAKKNIEQKSFEFAQGLSQTLINTNAVTAQQGFNIQKGLAITQATVSTANAVVKALSETTDPTPTQTLRFANAAAVGLAGAAQIAAIASQQFNASSAANSGGGGSSTSAPSVSYAAPQFNIAGDDGTNQLGQAINNQTQTPVKAYVTTKDFNSTQALERNINNSSRIGG